MARIAAISPYTGKFDFIGGSTGGNDTIVNSPNVIAIPPSVLAELGTADNLAAVLIELTERSKTYIFTQPTSSSTWSIPHQLGTEAVTIRVEDETGCTIIGYDIIATDEDNTQLIFDIPFQGTAYLNR